MEFKILDYGTPKIVADRLFAGAEAARNNERVMARVVLDFMRVTETQFSSGGRRGGGQWAALKPDTVRKKGSTQILRTRDANPRYSDPGNDALFRSITVPAAPYQVFVLRRDGFEFGTDRPFAEVQQRGSAKRGIPARPFLRALPGDISRWRNMITDHLMRVFNETGATP